MNQMLRRILPDLRKGNRQAYNEPASPKAGSIQAVRMSGSKAIGKIHRQRNPNKVRFEATERTPNQPGECGNVGLKLHTPEVSCTRQWARGRPGKAPRI